ncbi:MAG: hypothetical protein QOG06_566 [Gaiellaceae bacterium]|jgi:hypothetical protein|nr:hypothetical protein [Gaiellaceae bacterium]
MARRAGAEAAVVGCLLFVAACALPWIGLFRGHLGTSIFQHYGDSMLSGRLPYRDFSLEYPPGSLPAFAVPSFGPSRDYDSWFMAFEAGCGFACVGLVGLVSRSRAAAAYCALAPLALGPLTLHRYDLWAAALATAGLVAVVRRRPELGAGVLGVAAAAKIFPVVLLPLLLARAGWRALAAFAVGLAVVLLPFMTLAPGGVRYAFERQAGRALQLESVGSAGLLALHTAGAYEPTVVFGRGSWNLSGGVPTALAVLLTVLQVAAVVLVWWLYARGPRTAERSLAAATAAVAVWIAFAKVLSPQFLLWLVPLVALLRAPRHAVLLLAVLGLTQAVYPGRYDALVGLQTVPVALLAARDAVLLVLAGWLVADLQRQGVSQEVRRQRERSESGDGVLLDRRQGDSPDGVPGLEPGGGE